MSDITEQTTAPSEVLTEAGREKWPAAVRGTFSARGSGAGHGRITSHTADVPGDPSRPSVATERRGRPQLPVELRQLSPAGELQPIHPAPTAQSRRAQTSFPAAAG